MASLLAFAVGAQAQDQIKCLTAEPVDFAEGETTADFVVSMDYETDKEICSWAFNLYLPEGLTIAKDEDDFWLGEYSKETNATAVTRGLLNVTEKNDGGYLILGYATGNPKMKSTHGALVTLTLAGSAAIKGEGQIKNTSCSYMNGSDAVSADQGLLADITFAVNGGGSGEQGINDIKADAAAGKVYTIGGQQVVAPTKGLYIQNGKKVIVK